MGARANATDSARPGRTGSVPSRTASTNPTTSPPDTTDDLTQVKGIGPVYADRLVMNGVASLADLAAADTAELARAIDVSAGQVKEWQDQARNLE